MKELTELDFIAFDIYYNEVNNYPKMYIQEFSILCDIYSEYYNEAIKILRKEKLKNINVGDLNIKSLWNFTSKQTDELISDLYNIRSFDDIAKEESKIINNIIRKEKIEKLNKLLE